MQGEVYGDFALRVPGGATLVPSQRGGCCGILRIAAVVIGIGSDGDEALGGIRELLLPLCMMELDRRMRDDIRSDGSGRATLVDGRATAELMAVPVDGARAHICASFAE